VSLRLAAVLTHPIQYYSPWFRSLSGATDLTVYYAHRQTGEGQAQAGFSTAFDWDVPLLDGYDWRWLDNVSRSPGLRRFDGCDTPGIGPILRQGRYDGLLMFGWNRKCFLQAGWAAARSGIPILIRVDSQFASNRSGLKRALKWPVYSAVLPHAAHYLSPGRRTDDYLHHYAVPDRRIHRLTHMVDTERFRIASEAARASGETTRLRQTHDVAADGFVFLIVAKLIAKKRPMLLLEALRQMRAEAPGPASSVQVWIAGEGPLRGELEDYAVANDLPVRFLGFVNQAEMPAVYAASDCLVLPSNGEETWGLVVNEAFACGVPAIVSAEAGCAPEMIVDGRTGWTLASPDAGELARLMRLAIGQARQMPPGPLDELTDGANYAAGSHRLVQILSGIRTATARKGNRA
jgi:glycosyltransferase involved in cell wall biosynthesis